MVHEKYRRCILGMKDYRRSMKMIKIVCNECNEIIFKCPAEKYKNSELLAQYLQQKHRREQHKIYCESCKHEIKQLFSNDFGDKINWHTPWEQYLCDVCHDNIWKDLLDNACGVCHTHPCERGGDCWINPWPQIMYLCYVAPRTG